jgi:xanthine dehydrogenase YagR molybdenum-binding subunit
MIADEEYPGSEIFDRKTYVIKRGDIEKGLKKPVIVEDTYTTRLPITGRFRPSACIADWDGKNLTVWDAIQGVWNSKETFAQSLGIPTENIRVIVKYLGGGFGSKAWSQRISYYAAKLSIMTGRPVKMERTRAEEFLAHSRRWDCKMYENGREERWDATAVIRRPW